MAKKLLKFYFNSWWLPAILFLVLLASFTATVIPPEPLPLVADSLFYLTAIAFLGMVSTTLWNLLQKRWAKGAINALLVVVCCTATIQAISIIVFASMFGPSEDGFADDLTIPQDIEIAEPDSGFDALTKEGADKEGVDELQGMVRKALAVPGNDVADFTPDMPSLRRAATDHAKAFSDYVEASPDWHVFIEQGNRFAARRWSYGGEPRDTLHGYISEFGAFGEKAGFQTRCLLCLDGKQWGRYAVQHAEEGKKPIEPEMSIGNELHKSRVMIECGGVWVEVFEESNKLERRVTKATVVALEKEFSEFLRGPKDALAAARFRSRELAKRLAGKEDQPFRLITGMQPGIYEVVYSLNPGEPGSVYLKAFEITKGTPLSVDRLEGASETRMTWSTDTAERFGAKAGFTIYEGDWGKPYAARFEVWFKPDSDKTQHKLAERIYKIEGWQR